VWSDTIEEGALEQAHNITNLPFVFKHVVLAPDAHLGYGCPIGGVFATTNVVVSNAVGLDIGCGVRAWNTGVSVDDFMSLRDKVMHDFQRSIPVGFKWHAKPQEDEGLLDDVENLPVVGSQRDRALLQLGTLGSGNHFCEVQKDDSGIVWVMLHSGSRNLGKQVAEHYNKLAVSLNAKWHSSVPKEYELAFLPLDTDEGKLYMAEMNKCLEFAKLNRKTMMQAVKCAFAHKFGVRELFTEDIDVHHNYATFEHHYGKNVLVHRKGAVHAVGTVIIPGSMGSHSYLAKGLENPASFKSCSHGAGRAMGRKAAGREIPAADVIKEMAKLDVMYASLDTSHIVEESRQAYKDIDTVMANQADLVQPVTKLIPLAVLKA
jgi:tRNA-splicing ligase RtcB